MTYKDLADLIFPNITKTIADYEEMYPLRDLPEGATPPGDLPDPKIKPPSPVSPAL